MPCSWEGNRMSGVALAMRHREREIILFAIALQAYQKGYKPI